MTTSSTIQRLQQEMHRLRNLERRSQEPIAITGIGCRLAGNVTSPEEFWQLFDAGVDVITEVPPERWDAEAIYDPEPTAVGKSYARWGGFLDGVDQFDAAFFDISPREAAQMDPQQRFFLEVSAEALEDAGLSRAQLAGSATGVYVGVFNNDYAFLTTTNIEELNIYSGTGTMHNTLTGRLSYLLDLRGPSLPVDTACSSSLVAVHLACQSLRAGETNLALAGGVSLMLAPHLGVITSRMQVMAPDGHCKTFDANADGFVRGEGCVMIVLKRLSDAQRDGDHIWAVIQGTATNQDGRSASLTAPNGDAQQIVIRQALAQAQIPAEQVSFVETHGTGTALGDPIEVSALAATYGQAHTNQPCFLGALKTNIGHLDAAAGIVGLLKAVMTLRHETIPMNLHFQSLNPNITLEGTRLALPNTPQPWPVASGARYAAVSSFGWSGTNAHAILGEAPPQPANNLDELDTGAGRAVVLPLSARSPQALTELADRYTTWLDSDATQAPALADIGYTASLRRNHYEYRLAAVGSSHVELAQSLQTICAEVAGQQAPRNSSEPPRIVFVFPGQGSQWLGMGRQLMAEEPVFHEQIVQIDAALRTYVDWSLLDVLSGEAGEAALNRIDVIQPTLFAMQAALATLWQTWGVDPDAVIGHSMGEVAAAYVAGALTLEDAARIICRRSLLLLQVSGQGAMAVVELSFEQAQHEVADQADRLAVAVSNSAHSTVLSGDPAAIDIVLARLDARGIFCRHVKVDVASHSPQMDPLRPQLLDTLAGIQPQAAPIPIYSTVTTGCSDGAAFDAAYWADNLREPVRFVDAVKQALADEHTVFVEISAHPLLVNAMKETVIAHQSAQGDGLVLPSLRRDTNERTALFSSLAKLYRAGVSIAWDKLYPTKRPVTRLPTYPWQHKRYWKTASAMTTQNGSARNGRLQRSAGKAFHPLVGVRMRTAPRVTYFEGQFDQTIPFVNDYRYYGRMIVSAASYVEMGLAAAEALFTTPGQRVVEQVTIHQAMVVLDDAARVVQTILDASESERLQFEVWSLSHEQLDAADPTWQLHATGQIRNIASPDTMLPELPGGLQAIQARCPCSAEPTAMLDTIEELGYQYGASLRGLTQLWHGDGEALGYWELPDALQHEITNYYYHPALLHSCLYVLAAQIITEDRYVSVGFERCRFFAPPQRAHWIYTTLRADDTNDSELVVGDAWISDAEGRVIAQLEGIYLKRGTSDTLLRGEAAEHTDWWYQVHWEPQPIDTDPRSRSATGQPGQTGQWLIFADKQGIGQQVAALLEQQGLTCVLVHAGDETRLVDRQHYLLKPGDSTATQELLAQIAAHAADNSVFICGILHLWSLDIPAIDSVAEENILAGQRLSCESVLYLVQACVQAGWIHPPRFVLVTQQAQALAADTQLPAVLQAPLGGLSRVIQNEHPELACTYIDIDSDPASISALANELVAGQTAAEVALRAGQRLVAHLASYDAPQAPVNVAAVLQADATYLITGGLGGIGLAVAEWMVAQGAQHLALMSRRATMSDEVAQTVATLRANGARIELVQADVADFNQVQAAFARIDETLPPLRGVMHVAGVPGKGMLTTVTYEDFAQAMTAKVAGTWNLHQLTQERSLDFLVLFSSMATLMGATGQSGYPAANAFLDTFATYRCRQGLPGLSVNWGIWQHLGMAKLLEENAQYNQRLGAQVMRREQALAALTQLLQTAGQPNTTAHVAVAPMDWARVNTIPLLRKLSEQAARRTRSQSQPQVRSHLLHELKQQSDHRQRSALIEQYLLEQTARTLAVPPAQLDAAQSLQALGFDSLMNLELKAQIERDLELALPLRIFMQGATLRKVGELVLNHLIDETDQPDRAAAQPSSNGQHTGDAALTSTNGHYQDQAAEQAPHFAGRSLPAVPLPAACAPLFGRALPHGTLLHVATASPLLVLHPGGTGTPCYWVHAGFGDVLSYLPLAHLVGADRPVYAFQAPDPLEAPGVYTSIAAMAAAYVALLRAHQPDGPYLLGGWSFGGAVAFEMAQQLWQAGVRDVQLVLLDTWLTDDRAAVQNPALLTALCIDRLAFGFGLTTTLAFEALHTLPVDEQIARAMQWLKDQRILDADTPTAYVQEALRIAQATAQLGEGYQPRLYPGALTFIRAEAGMPLPYQRCGFVRDGSVFTAEQRDDFATVGDHTTMLRHPYVQKLADRLRMVLAGAAELLR